MRRLLSIPRPGLRAALKAVLKPVRVLEAVAGAAEAAVRVEAKAGMIRVQAATMAPGAIVKYLSV
jgi:hypothetical protein